MAAAIPLAVSAFGSYMQSRAAGSAADAQVAASRQATKEQRKQLAATEESLSPYMGAGTSAISSQQALLGLLGPEAQAQAFQQFTESPGQAFLRQRGEQSLLRNASAIGGLGGGNIRSALQQQGIGFAQTDLQNQLQQLRMMSESGRGSAEALGGFRSGTAANTGNLMIAGGEARASGILGQQQANQQILGMAGGALGGGLAGSGAFGTQLQQAYGGSAGAGAYLGML